VGERKWGDVTEKSEGANENEKERKRPRATNERTNEMRRRVKSEE